MNDLPLQMMDITSLQAVLADLRKEIVPSRLEKVQQSDNHTLQIGFRTLRDLIWIEICWHADSARIVQIDPPAKISGESTLCKQIKFGTKGMALIELKQNGFERIVEFGLAFRPNENFEKFLVLEIMGRHSNFLLLNESRQVITLGKQVRKNQSRLRPIGTGDKYVPPPPLNGQPPKRSESFEEWKSNLSMLPKTLKEALKDCYQGISPSLSLQLASEEKESAEEFLNLQVQALSQTDWKRLHYRWSKWLKDLERENFCISFSGPSAYRVWKPNLSNDDNYKKISLSLGNYYKNNLEAKKLNHTYKRLSEDIIRIKANEEKSLKTQEELFSKISEIKSLQIQAENILCLNNPTKKQVAQAQKLYNKVKKLKRSKAILMERISYHKERLSFANEIELFLEYIMNNTKENKASKIEDIENYLLLKQQKGTKKIKQKKDITNILQLQSPSGLIIQIGRNHHQNELISIRKANKGDIWFHAQESPGSHVVIKASNGKIDQDDLKVGADLAALFSKAKQNKKVSILMVPTNKLKKLKGTAPGMVSPRDSKVLWGYPSNGQKYLEQSTKNA
ncbi:putative secreted protein MPB70 precursor [Prochlorococcus marinus str. SS51]|uniref:NFACT RNA binding domain-containing protein n=1 Tax=Prochlorococcus marinus TaxID=1219 RepID=UPI000533BB89|nr:NFACT RNA binding domain-containing protein [Prochlorococcus marinus]KGG33811.1 putative secreted protein MPB70 precursor [Prochlorococcus marinus str. SS51]